MFDIKRVRVSQAWAKAQQRLKAFQKLLTLLIFLNIYRVVCNIDQ